MSPDKVTWETHGEAWKAMVEKAMTSSKVVDWRTGGTLTSAHFVRNMEDGKPFVAQFDRLTGELVTAFKPNNRQVAQIYKLLSGS